MVLPTLHISHSIVSSKNAPKRLQRILLRLQPFNISQGYILGNKMHMADVLNRDTQEVQIPSTRKDSSGEVWTIAQ